MKSELLICFSLTTLFTAAQNIGIGTSTPSGPLSFGNVKNSLGQTISLQDNRYGLSAEGNDMVFTLGPINTGNSNILLGHGRSAAFNEVMRIQNNRRIGIGVSSPQESLDVNGRIRSLWFGTNTTPGILYGYTDLDQNVVGPYFLGMYNNSTVGILSGAGSAWHYEANTGALALAGSYGTAGQIAMVKTGEYVTTWSAMPSFSDPYNGTLQYFEPTTYTLTDAAPTATLGAFNITFTYSKWSKVMVDYSISLSTNSCTLCGPTYFWVNTYLDGALISSSRYMVANGRSTTVTDGVMLRVGTTNTLRIEVSKSFGPTLLLPAAAGRLSTLIVSPYPVD